MQYRRQADHRQTIVRDMWALRLQKVQIKVSHDSGTDTEGNSQMFSSQSEGETGTDTDGSRASRRRQRKQSEVSVNLVDTLSLCYIGILLLRIPLTVADLHRWCNDGKLLYYKSSKEVPAGMVERLPGEYQQLLEAQDLLPPQRLHASVLKTVSSFSEELGMLPPSPNHPLLMYRWVRELSLPLEVFSGTQRLARILGIDFNFKVRAKAGSSVVLRYPEAQLMALIVVATKLLFPMHCTEQIAQSSSDLSALTMNWDAWVGARPRKTVEHGDGEGLNFEQAFNFSETECLENADQQLDQYLDWYENNVASETVRTRGRAGKDADFRHNLFSMFPLEASKMDADQIQTPQATSQDTNMLRYVQRSLTTRPSVSASNSAKPSLRPGSLYRRYRKAQELNGVVRMFYQAAAELAGLSLEGIVQAVFLLERKLQKYEEKLRDKA